MHINITVKKLRLQEGFVQGSVFMTNTTMQKHFPFDFEVRNYGQPKHETILRHKGKEFLHADENTKWEDFSSAQTALFLIFYQFEPIISQAVSTWEGSKKALTKKVRRHKELEGAQFEYLEADFEYENEFDIPDTDEHIADIKNLFSQQE
ncbi:hypothetical protein HY031_01890 [Candidatus Gottesmanbacteria bacterium]|nr:hypothetical protein [Candidatus Gottesmanbacteria bacterium]